MLAKFQEEKPAETTSFKCASQGVGAAGGSAPQRSTAASDGGQQEKKLGGPENRGYQKPDSASMQAVVTPVPLMPAGPGEEAMREECGPFWKQS